MPIKNFDVSVYVVSMYPCHLHIVLNWYTEFKNCSSCSPHTLGGLGGGGGSLDFGLGGSGGPSSRLLCGRGGGL